MKRAVRAIVIRDDHLLVMHRNKFGHQYYTLIGGGVGIHETPEQALYREIREETGLTVANPRLIYLEDAGKMYGLQCVFLCDYAGGEIAMDPQSDEAKINAIGQNLYTPMWLPLDDLPDVEFLSTAVQQRIIRARGHGWPAQVEQF